MITKRAYLTEKSGPFKFTLNFNNPLFFYFLISIQARSLCLLPSFHPEFP